MQLKVDDVNICYDQYTALQDISFQLEKGEIACLVGPSGCGKTSLQRAIAGFENVSKGEIFLADQIVSNTSHTVAPEHRKVGMVFQDFALFPHLSVAENIGFGLHTLKPKEREHEISSLLELIGLPDAKTKYPHELSGGQQQRVALARAIAPRPEILLLDEAFSSLDSTLREQLARDVRILLKAKNITAILATHNQYEAFAIADKIGVMRNGNLLQWDTPYHIYHRPSSRFVAQFIGEGSLIDAHTDKDGKLHCALGQIAKDKRWDTEKNYKILVRPDDILYQEGSAFRLEILEKRFRGAEYLYKLKLNEHQWIQCETPSHLDRDIGSTLPVITDLEHVVVFDDDGLEAD